MTFLKYQAFCLTENKYVTVVKVPGEAVVNLCPNNHNHTLQSGFAVVESFSNLTVTDESGRQRVVNEAQSLSEDGKGYVVNTPRPKGTYTYFTGRFDSPTAVGIGGKLEVKTVGGATSASITGQFRETVFMNGMWVRWDTGIADCEVSYEIHAPATVLVPGAGPVNVVTGVIVPAAGPTAGAYSIGTKGHVPVPVANLDVPNGYWDVVVAGTKITKKKSEWYKVNIDSYQVVSNGNPTGHFNMYAVPLKLNRFGNMIGLMGSGNEKFVAYDAEPCLPFWTHKVVFMNPDAVDNARVRMTALLFRKTTI